MVELDCVSNVKMHVMADGWIHCCQKCVSDMCVMHTRTRLKALHLLLLQKECEHQQLSGMEEQHAAISS